VAITLRSQSEWVDLHSGIGYASPSRSAHRQQQHCLVEWYVETGDNGEQIKVKILYLLSQMWTETGNLQGIRSLESERSKFLEYLQPKSSNERIAWNEQYTRYLLRWDAAAFGARFSVPA
jgi:hypothetical protein